MPKSISLFVHNLGTNPVARVLPFVNALKEIGYEVQVLGFLIGEDRDVHIPYQDEIDPVVIQTSLRTAELFPNIRRLAHAATGDVIYSFKPLVTTFAPAYYAACVIQNRPLLLDVEDEEVYLDDDWGLEAAWRKLFRGWRLGISWKYTRLLQLFRWSIDKVTVVSTRLQDRYGGTIIRHGPNEDQFSPDPYAEKEEELRAKWGLPPDRKLAVFTGTPRSHKGVKVLVDALCLEKSTDWDFVLVGPKDNEFASYARKKLPKRGHLLGPHPYEQIPEVLSIADAIPIPQKKTAFAAAQVPAKLLDAMAMARPIVASAIGDLPDILGDGKRGWLVEPDSPHVLADALQEIGDEPEKAEERGRDARRWFMENASTTAIAEQLSDILEPVTPTR